MSAIECVIVDFSLSPMAVSLSFSASANLAVNLSRIFNVLSLAVDEAPSRAALMAWMSSAKEDFGGPEELRYGEGKSAEPAAGES